MKSWVTSPHGLTVFSEEGDLVAEFELTEAMKIANAIDDAVYEVAEANLSEPHTKHMNGDIPLMLRLKGII
jgi:hypothetical protein